MLLQTSQTELSPGKVNSAEESRTWDGSSKIFTVSNCCDSIRDFLFSVAGLWGFKEVHACIPV